MWRLNMTTNVGSEDRERAERAFLDASIAVWREIEIRDRVCGELWREQRHGDMPLMEAINTAFTRGYAYGVQADREEWNAIRDKLAADVFSLKSSLTESEAARCEERKRTLEECAAMAETATRET